MSGPPYVLSRVFNDQVPSIFRYELDLQGGIYVGYVTIDDVGGQSVIFVSSIRT